MPSPRHFSAGNRQVLPPSRQVPLPADNANTANRAKKWRDGVPKPPEIKTSKEELDEFGSGPPVGSQLSQGSQGSEGSAASKFERRGSRIFEATEASAKGLGSTQAPPNYLSKSSISSAALLVITNKWFERTFYVVLIMNAIEMGLALAYNEDKYDTIWLAADVGFAVLFTIESLLTLVALGHHAFLDFWRAVQFFATVASVGDCAMTITGLGEDYSMTSRALKSTRFLLLGKLFSLNAETKLIVISMARSLKSLRGVLVVIVVICYGCTLGVYSVVGLKGEAYDEKGVTFGTSPHETYFGNITRTMLTLFSVLILSEWDSVARGIYEVQPYFVVFFVGFTVLLTFGLMNVLVGIIVDTVNQIHQEHEEKKRKEELKVQQSRIEKLVEFVFEDDNDITLDEFLHITENRSEIISILREFKVPWGFTFGDLFSILDDDKDGHLTKSELSDGLFSLVAGGETERFCISQLSMSKTHSDLVELRAMISDVAGNQRMLAERLFSEKSESLRKTSSGKVNMTSFFMDAVEGSSAYQSAERRSLKREELSPTLRREVSWTPMSPVTSPSRIKRKEFPLLSGDDLWGQCYQTLHIAVERHCKKELQLAWQSLQSGQQSGELSPDFRSRSGLLPDMNLRSGDVNRQEHFVVRNKLHDAVVKESAAELRKAIDHAIAAGIDSHVLAIELTYNDALKRNQPATLPTAEMKDAMEKGDWSSALDMLVESAVASGADKHILANVIIRLSDASSTSQLDQAALPQPTESGLTPRLEDEVKFPSQSSGGERSGSYDGRRGSKDSIGSFREPSLQGRAANVRKAPNLVTSFRVRKWGDDEAHAQGQLLALLQSEAFKHSQEEMSKAWERLDRSFGEQNTPGTKPLSPAEELFFICNQMFSAVQRKSFADLQRALNQAVAAGLDMRNMEVEVAYRDALARYHKGSAQTIRLAVDAFRRKEWYLALDLVIQTSLARGADRQSLLRALTKIYASCQSNQSSSWC